jgi:hypothetical protein
MHPSLEKSVLIAPVLARGGVARVTLSERSRREIYGASSARVAVARPWTSILATAPEASV